MLNPEDKSTSENCTLSFRERLMMKSDLAKTYLGTLASTTDKEQEKAKKKIAKAKEKLSYTPTARQVQDLKAAEARMTEEEHFNRKLACAIKKKKKEKKMEKKAKKEAKRKALLSSRD